MQVRAFYSGRMPDASDWRSDEYVYVQIADLLAEKIASGELAPGDRLPSELEVAETYGVARDRRGLADVASRYEDSLRAVHEDA